MTEELDLPRQPGEGLLEYAKRRAAAQGIRLPERPPDIQWQKELIPDVEGDVSPQQLEISRVLEQIDIVAAYTRWCGKMVPNVGNKVENIMVSCPVPGHLDEHPSAALTLRKGPGGVGDCYKCQIGFDKFDLAAWRYGFASPGEKIKDFPALCLKMAEELGYRVMVQGRDTWLESKTQGVVATDPPPGTAVEAGGTEPAERRDDPPPTPATTAPAAVPPPPIQLTNLPWRLLPALSTDTFFHKWMEITSDSYEPEEFYFWLGLQALAASVGNNVTLEDYRPVKGNLMVCYVGRTGDGKSNAFAELEKLLRTALPWRDSDGGGVRMISSPGSGETLIDRFSYYTIDPADPTNKTRILRPVNGFYREAELSTFISKGGRLGSTVRQVVMDMFDGGVVGTTSRTHGEVIAQDYFFQLGTTTQTESINELLTRADLRSGFLNRFAYSFGTEKIRPAFSTDRIDTTPCVDLLRNLRGWGSPGRVVRMMPGAAADLWTEFYDEEIYPRRSSSDLTVRLDLLAKKLLLLFAVNERKTEITVEHVESLKIMWTYLLSCYGVVDKHIGLGEVDSCAEDIMKYMAARATDQITIRQLAKQSGARKFGLEVIKKTIDLLVHFGSIEEVPRERGDRTVRYRYLSDPPPVLGNVIPLFKNDPKSP